MANKPNEPVLIAGAKTTANDPIFTDIPSVFDPCTDMLAPDGKIASHWEGLIEYMNTLGRKELERRWQKARQIMHEHGVAYNIFSGQKKMERPWELDPIPFPISMKTWDFLERGIRQRTRLLTAIFSDIYGPQTLIRNYHLPPELFFANPRFLRQCNDLYTGVALKLHFHATDLCRFPDNQWRVMSDRTQAPSGAGYALENRIILSRILPRMFHSGKVLRLAPFFKFLNHALMTISGLEKHEPFVVMLSSGPSSPTYFEHVFLARYLGITLVESSDLTIRDDTVFLKTLGGLNQVDVIFRRIEDHFCDPLVFGSNSLIGVSGLVQAVRAGNVAVSNPLGSGVLETPGLIPFLPGLCRQLLGEDLIVQDLPTAWCGQKDPLNRVLARLGDENHPMIIASAFARPHLPAVDTRGLSREEISALAKKILAAPYAYISRDPISPCKLPVWEEGGLVNSYAAISMFSSAMTPAGNLVDPDMPDDTVRVMPGALTRISRDPAAFLINTGKEQGSKDTWCFSPDIVDHVSMIHTFTQPLEIHRGSDLPSRVADNMLWLGRYIERTEGMLRVVRSVLNRINSETRLDLIGEFPFLLRMMATLDIISPALAQPDVAYNMQIVETQIFRAMFGTEPVGSIRGSLNNVKKVATSVRDRLSNDSWLILGRMENELNRFVPLRHNQISEVQELVDEMLLTLSAFAGLAQESMTRGMGWRFMDMGRRIERARYMIGLLQRLFSSKGIPKSHDLEVLLEVADSTITYHTRYRTTFHMDPIVDLLLLDELNPRAVGFQMAALFDHVETLPRSAPRPFRTKEEKRVLDLTTQLRLTDIGDLMEMPPDGSLPKLSELLTRLNTGLGDLTDSITQHYLSKIETEKQLKNLMDDPAHPAHLF
ncbi:MAG: circularly permuted type 2 ATP-grasp protein [Proteobacteria bacterium]|nr:hypothetical protein [Desulfobacula sp.]MBU3954776.1 circularly permuted type 2 ATP-grasp protein [Pseudomonadota bacterium]MBU4133527.1 circularly permuted type 2 ATP-grasp protein [Pseudomonadota bacterium]